MSKKTKPQIINLSNSSRLKIEPSEYKGRDYIQIAKQFLLAGEEEWFFKTSLNIPPDKWEEFKKAVNSVKVS